MLEKIFSLTKKHTNVKTEIIAGLTTFLAMAYILAVNPGMLAVTGMPQEAVFFATAVSAGLASILMGVLANYPVSLAPGMGVNALFTYTVVLTYGYSWEAALATVFVSGLLFVVISVTGIRKMIINAIPKNMKLAIGAGIGFFIAFIGFINGGIVVDNASTLVSLGNFKDPVVLLAIFGILVTIVLMAKNINGSVFIGIIITTVVGIIMRALGLEGISAPLPALPTGFMSVNLDFSTVGAFARGFKDMIAQPTLPLVLFSFLFVDFFDTAGTLVAVGNNIGLVNENGEMENVEKALLSDSIGTVVGAALGTSTVTSFVESGSGVAAGGRTGLTAVTTGVCFLLSVFFYPILSVITSAATAPALIIVGVLMAQQLKEIDWPDFTTAVPAFLTVIIMILGYSISDGIAFGFIAYTVSKLAAGRHKEIQPIVYVLDFIFVAYFLL
ncbi:MAG: NCS2 family permease [Erysipelotrichaceae bacterium]|nr:NCS2 family permease [Erysipelotrichaceae bacterium]